MSTLLANESNLVQALRKQDRAAMEYLYDHYSTALFGIILRVVGQSEAAQDVLQESFIKIWKNIEHYDANRGRLFTWMLNIARNKAIDYTRGKHQKRAHQQQSLEPHVYEQATLVVKPRIDTIGLRELVSGLLPEQKTLIELVYFEGYTHAEAAKALNMPLGTVKTRVRAAIKKLRQLR